MLATQAIPSSATLVIGKGLHKGQQVKDILRCFFAGGKSPSVGVAELRRGEFRKLRVFF